MKGKTTGGVTIEAQQRAKRDTYITSGVSAVCSGSMGELIVSSEVGDERGAYIKMTISLDEVLAWLPEMTEKARQHSASKATQKLTEDLRQEGYLVTTWPRLKIADLRRT